MRYVILIFFILLSSTLKADDLNGNNLSCYAKDGSIQEDLAIKFVENFYAHFSYVRRNKGVIIKHLSAYDLFFRYHVTENQILVDSRTHEIFGTWTVIDRYSLSLDYPFIQGHNCEVVDYDPIEKIRDIKSKDKKL